MSNITVNIFRVRHHTYSSMFFNMLIVHLPYPFWNLYLHHVYLCQRCFSCGYSYAPFVGKANFIDPKDFVINLNGPMVLFDLLTGWKLKSNQFEPTPSIDYRYHACYCVLYVAKLRNQFTLVCVVMKFSAYSWHMGGSRPVILHNIFYRFVLMFSLTFSVLWLESFG